MLNYEGKHYHDYHIEESRKQIKQSIKDYEEHLNYYHGHRPMTAVTPRLLWSIAAFLAVVLPYAGWEAYRETKQPAKATSMAAKFSDIKPYDALRPLEIQAPDRRPVFVDWDQKLHGSPNP
jgi:hypothetical protein